MKLIIAALFMLMIMAVIFQAASSMSVVDFNGRSQASDSDAKKIETKMAESLHNVALSQPIGVSAAKALDQIENGSTANSTANISAFNSSLNTNTSFLNSSTLNSSAQNKTISSDSTKAASQEMGTSSKGASKGFWGIQANKHVMGQSDIKSRMFLSGNFDVDKTVQFSDKGD